MNRVDYTDLMNAIQFKDCVNSYKESHKLSKWELLELLKGEVEETEEAMKDKTARKADELLEIADIGVFCGLLYNKIKQEKRK